MPERKSRLNKERAALVKELKLTDSYDRTHTATGVIRRRTRGEQGAETASAASKSTSRNERSLANLRRRSAEK